MANVTVGESTRQESSLSSTDVLNQIAEPLGTSSAEQVTSHDKIRLAFPLSASSLFSPYRPAVRGSLGAQRLFTVSRRDESLVAWLASQPDTKKQFDQLGTAEIWESDDASEADGVYIDSIELVFAQLESN
jgi:hypothetical protein